MGRLALLFLAAPLAWGSNCSRTSVGFTPFTNPFPPAYQGQQVSLYSTGNVRPAAHDKLGLQQAAQIVARDSAGNPSANGKIVLLSVGMSNTTMEFTAFLAIAQADARKDSRVLAVDGAVSGATAAQISSQPDSPAQPNQYWATVEQRLEAANASDNQVQAIWLKEADANPTAPFPNHAQTLQNEIETMIQQARARFPNLKIVYLSSRIYAGYASSTLNPEPYAYEGAFAVKWLIEKQIGGAPEMDVASGTFPWLAWGPYLWADGLTPRSDGLTWVCADLQSSDGTHPAASGQQKVARLLLDFFHSDSTARTWYLAQQSDPAPAIGALVNSAGWGTSAANSSLASIFGLNLAGSAVAAAGNPYPYELAGTSVEVDGAPTLLYYVSPGQINFVLPTSGQSLAVVRDQTSSAAWPLTLLFWAPGLYTLDYAPNGPAAALHADGSLVTALSPALPGEGITALGTGLGYVDPALMIPVPAPLAQVGGRAVNATAGPMPGQPGVTQVTFTIPADVQAGPAVSLVFQLGTALSNAATLPVGN